LGGVGKDEKRVNNLLVLESLAWNGRESKGREGLGGGTEGIGQTKRITKPGGPGWHSWTPGSINIREKRTNSTKVVVLRASHKIFLSLTGKFE
jgi:hypothetical protein